MTIHFDSLKLPSAADCAHLRALTGLSLSEMADVVHLANRQSWWRFEAGLRQCDLPMWELALLKSNQHPSHKISLR